MLSRSEEFFAAPVPARLRRLPRRRAPWLALPALLLAAAACQPFAQRLTVPVSRWPGYEFLPLAHARQLDRRHGLSLDLKTFTNPQDIVHAYLRGELQIAQLTTVEAVDLCNRVPKRCPVVVLVLDESRGGDQVLVERSLPSIAALRGRPVAITPSTLGPFLLSRALNAHGLGLGDVELRPMPLEAMPQALARRDVVAAALYPPFSDAAMRGAPVRPLFTSREIPGQIFDVLVVDPALLQRARQPLVRLLRTWQAAHDELSQRPQPASALMAQREGVTPADFRASLQGLVFLPLARQQDLFRKGGTLQRNLLDLREVQATLGLMSADGPLPGVDGSLIEAALLPSR
jgi:NitT/TauT family transport system substrate-binding protein